MIIIQSLLVSFLEFLSTNVSKQCSRTLNSQSDPGYTLDWAVLLWCTGTTQNIAYNSLPLCCKIAKACSMSLYITVSLLASFRQDLLLALCSKFLCKIKITDYIHTGSEKEKKFFTASKVNTTISLGLMKVLNHPPCAHNCMLLHVHLLQN